MKDNNPADNLAWRVIWRQLISSVGSQARMLRRSMLALLLAAFMQGIAFACLYPIIDALLRGDAPQLLNWAMAFSVAAIVTLVLRWYGLGFEYRGHLAQATHELRLRLGEQLRRVPLEKLQRGRAGEMNALLLGSVDENLNYVIAIANILLLTIVTPLTASLATLWIDWRLGLVMLLIFPLLVRAAGGSLALAGATTLFMLPWALKFIWAPWIERWRLPPGSQERRSRMLILRGQVALAAILTIAAAIGWFGREGGFPDTQIVALFVLFMVAGTVASTIDIASDGFCVDQLTRTGYGWGNSVQVGGSYLGMMCGGGVFLMLSAASGWPVAMLMMAVLIMALSLPLWRITEPTRTATIPHVPALGYALRRKQARLGLLLVLMLNSGMRFVLPLLAPLLLDHGLSMSALGALFSGGNIAAGIAGTLAGGLLMKYTSPGRALLTAYGVQGIALLAVVMTLMMAPGHLLLQILQCLVIVQSISLACALVCLYATLMSLSSPLQAGVDFTLFQCTDAAIAILAGVIGGVVAQHFGYAACFLFAGAFTLLAAWVAYIRLHSARELMTSAID